MLASVALLLTACPYSANFAVPDVTFDLAAIGPTSGRVVIAPLVLQTIPDYIDGSIVVSATSQTLAVHSYVLGSSSPTTAGCTASSAAPSTYLCDASTPGLTSTGSYDLAPGKPQAFTWWLTTPGQKIWIGVQLVGATASNATVTFTGMTGVIPGR